MQISLKIIEKKAYLDQLIAQRTAILETGQAVGHEGSTWRGVDLPVLAKLIAAAEKDLAALENSLLGVPASRGGVRIIGIKNG